MYNDTREESGMKGAYRIVSMESCIKLTGDGCHTCLRTCMTDLIKSSIIYLAGRGELCSRTCFQHPRQRGKGLRLRLRCENSIAGNGASPKPEWGSILLSKLLPSSITVCRLWKCSVVSHSSTVFSKFSRTVWFVDVCNLWAVECQLMLCLLTIFEGVIGTLGN